MLVSPSTSGHLKPSVDMRPVSLKLAGLRLRGATGPKSTTWADFSPARWTTQKPMPPMPEFHGSWLVRAKAAATAASMALPPLSSMRRPACAASGCEVATTLRASSGARETG